MAQYLQRRIAFVADLRMADNAAAVRQPGDAAAVVIVAMREHGCGYCGEIYAHQPRIVQETAVRAGIK
ncbi:hypothetical protein D3C87_1679330 [compost metagenome]